MSAGRALRVGIAGLGRAFTLMLPTFVVEPRLRIVAAADPRGEPRARFEAQFGATAHASHRIDEGAPVAVVVPRDALLVFPRSVPAA